MNLNKYSTFNSILFKNSNQSLQSILSLHLLQYCTLFHKHNLQSSSLLNFNSKKFIQTSQINHINQIAQSAQHKRQIMGNRKLFLFIAMSIDGFISKPNDDLSFLQIVEKEGEDHGYNEFISKVDTVIIGRKTYDWILKNIEPPHANKNTYVITRTPRPSIGNTVFYTGDLEELVLRLKSEEGKHIFCDGGAEVINELLKKDLIDEMIISVIPILLGDGIKLFKEGIPEQKLKLVQVKSFDTGLAQLHYKRIES